MKYLMAEKEILHMINSFKMPAMTTSTRSQVISQAAAHNILKKDKLRSKIIIISNLRL